jgi:hypothetical protein
MSCSFHTNAEREPLEFDEQAPPLSVLQIFRSVVDHPVGRAAPAAADIIIIDRPDRPSSIVAPNQNLRTNPRGARRFQRALTQSDLLEPPGRRCGCWSTSPFRFSDR